MCGNNERIGTEWWSKGWNVEKKGHGWKEARWTTGRESLSLLLKVLEGILIFQQNEYKLDIRKNDAEALCKKLRSIILPKYQIGMWNYSDKLWKRCLEYHHNKNHMIKCMISAINEYFNKWNMKNEEIYIFTEKRRVANYPKRKQENLKYREAGKYRTILM